MHKLGMSTCYETVVRRPDFEEELPPSSLLPPSQKLPSSSPSPLSSYPSSKTTFFFSHPVQCIFLFCTFATTIFPQIVFNRPQMFYNSAPLSFTFSFFFISFIPSQKPLLSHILTITLKNYFPASLSCCCYMSFQQICKLYTCWLRLILYLIKQLIDSSINQSGD